MADTDYEIILYRKGTAGSITMAAGDSSYVVAGSRKLILNENNISSLEFSLSNGSSVAAENFLSSSFAGWSGGVTGALQLGDYVRYSLYPTKAPTTKTQYFYGKIVELQQTQDGQLRIKAQNYLKKLEREYTKVIYKGYVDSAPKTAAWADGHYTISGITEDDIVTPLAYVAVAKDDTAEQIGTNTTASSQNIVTGDVAQPFVATQNGLLGVHISLLSSPSPNTGTIRISIQTDNGSGEPSGSAIAYADVSGLGVLGYYFDYDIDMTSSGVPVPLVVGKTYWVVYHYVSGTLTGCNPQGVTPVSTYPYTYYLWKSDGVNWAKQTSRSTHTVVHTIHYSMVEPADHVFSDTLNAIYCSNTTPSPVQTQTFVTPVRGMVSYFYGALTNQEIADALLALNTGLVSGSSSSQATKSGTFSTLGKRLLESLQELADQYMDSGSWSGYQLAFAHYESSGSHYVKFGKRLTTADTSYATFSHGLDSSTDDELRIIDWSGLKLRTDLRPSSVVVVGKDSNGNPLCYTVTDRALSTSFESRMEGFANALKVSDENITKLIDVWARGDGALAAYSTNVWEGQIKVSGVYPDLIDMDTASTSFGSGKIITLNLSPLGISALKLKVKGVTVEANQTTITLSNDDVLVNNAQRYYNAKAQRSEAFLAPVGLVDNMYIAVFIDDVADYSPGWVELRYESGGAIPGLSKAPTKHPVPALNLNVYHVEFEAADGHSAIGGTMVGVGMIYLRQSSGSATYKTYDLYVSTAPVRDERFHKFKTNRLIVDVLTKRQ